MLQKSHASARNAKSELSLRGARSQQRAAVAAVIKKKPAARAHHQKKRTPFTLKREGVLVQAGVKRSVYKQAHKKPASRAR